MDRRLTKEERLRKRRDFLQLRTSVTRLHTRHFIIVWERRGGDTPSRLGITVSRKVGCAVVRNRWKRLVREYFRQHKTLPRADFNFIVKKGSEAPGYCEVEQELDRAFARIAATTC